MTKAILIILSLGNHTTLHFYISNDYIYSKTTQSAIEHTLNTRRLIDLNTLQHHGVNIDENKRIVSTATYHKNNWQAHPPNQKPKQWHPIPLETLSYMGFDSIRIAKTHDSKLTPSQVEQSEDVRYSIYANLDKICDSLEVDASVLKYLPIHANKIEGYPYELKQWVEYEGIEHIISEVKAIEFGVYPIEDEIEALLTTPEKGD